MKEKPVGKRHVKCQHCKEYEYWQDRESMIIEKGEKSNSYIHKECYYAYQKSNEIKGKENEERNNLYTYILQLHNIKKIPPNFFYMIEDLRNGTDRYFSGNPKIMNKQKKGFKYEVIHKAYELSKKYCDNAIRTKTFKSPISEMIYCLRIVENNLLGAEQKITKEKRKQKIIDLDEQRVSEFKTRKVEYKKKGNENDILDLFE
jgi:hypothetical protein